MAYEILKSTLVSCIFVGFAYLPKPKQCPSNMPYESFEAWNTTKAAVYATLINLVVHLLTDSDLFYNNFIPNFDSSAIIYAMLLPIVMNTILFFGEWVQFFGSKTRDFREFIEDIFQHTENMVKFKFYISAPAVEEICYRGIILNLFLNSGDYTVTQSILISPLFFSVSHLHHIIKAMNEDSDILKREIAQRIFQAGFTWLFGVYSGFIYISSGGYLLAPIILHSYCNLIQIPHLGICFSSDTEPILRKILLGSYIIGIAVFFCLAFQL